MKLESLEEVRELGRQDFLELKAMIERLEAKMDREFGLLRQEIKDCERELRREMRQVRNWVISGIALYAGLLVAIAKFL